MLIATVIGAVLGLVLFRETMGLVAGGLIGYLASEVGGLKSRFAKLEHELGQRIEALEAASPKQVESTANAEAPTTGTEWSGATTTTVSPSPPPEAPPPPAPAIAAPPMSAATPTPPALGALDYVVQAAITFFTGGNTVARVGVIILFFGVAFLLKYAAEHATFPIELRLAATAVGALALLVAGMRLRHRREGYGLTLEGGGIGILYLTTFAALRLYELMPASFAFVLLLVICAGSVALALLQNALALAVLGVTGGFLAPILASTGAGSHVALFSYYAILNAGIFAVAWFRAWRPLNLIGFGFTFVIGTSWAYRYYRPEFFATTEPFLILFFLSYVAIPILFARRRQPELRDPVDGTLIFGVPIVGILLQAGLVKSFEYGLAWSAFVLGLFYLALSWIIWKRGFQHLLAEAFLALGVIFTTLAIPLAVNGHWTAAAWAIEGAGILWIGLRQSHPLAQVFGLLVQLGAGVIFATEVKPTSALAIANTFFLGAMLVSLAGLASAYLLARYRSTNAKEPALAIPMLAWGLGWWFGGTFSEIRNHVPSNYEISAWLALVSASTLLQERIAMRADWSDLRITALFNLALLVLTLSWAKLSLPYPFAHLGFLAWPFALGSYYFLLKRTEDMAPFKGPRHIGALWLLLAVSGWQIHWAANQYLPQNDLSIAVLGLTLASVIIALAESNVNRWPIRGNEWAYRVVGAIPLLLLALTWMLIHGLQRSGNPSPLPFIPLLNPLDVTAMFILLALFIWISKTRKFAFAPPEPLLATFAALAFAWVNAVVFRAIHHLAHVPYTLRAMLDSMLVQATLSIFWTVLAFGIMLAGARTRLRYLWFIGAGLLTVVVVKLFLVDLSNSGTIERIVSFLGVGLLLLVIGYLAPIPPSNCADKRHSTS